MNKESDALFSFFGLFCERVCERKEKIVLGRGNTRGNKEQSGGLKKKKRRKTELKITVMEERRGGGPGEVETTVVIST